MISNYKRLGDYVRLVDERNVDLRVTTLLGLTVNKKFIPSVANTIGTNMKNYKEGTQSSKTEKYAQMVKDLVNENSQFDVTGVVAPRAEDWENLFENQIKSKMQLGADRKYVASLAGKPGNISTPSFSACSANQRHRFARLII